MFLDPSDFFVFVFDFFLKNLSNLLSINLNAKVKLNIKGQSHGQREFFLVTFIPSIIIKIEK